MGRNEAFAKPPDPAWVPAVGDEVWVPYVRQTVTRLKSTGTVCLVHPPFVKVLVTYGRRVRVVLTYRISDIREAGSGRERDCAEWR